jgi:hypothetical protein
MADHMDSLLRELERLRQAKGEDAFMAASRNYAREFIRQGPGGVQLARKIFTSFLGEEVLSEIEAEVAAAKPEPEPTPVEAPAQPAPDPNQMMVEALRMSMPGLKTQAQFTAFMATFDALRALANSIFEGNKEAATQAQAALNQGIEALRLATDITRRLEEVPEAASGKGAEEFKKPPAQFGEYDVQRRLLMELETVDGLDTLALWYQQSKKDIDSVVSQTLRNTLVDAIRAKKLALEAR